MGLGIFESYTYFVIPIFQAAELLLDRTSVLSTLRSTSVLMPITTGFLAVQIAGATTAE